MQWAERSDDARQTERLRVEITAEPVVSEEKRTVDNRREFMSYSSGGGDDDERVLRADE